MCFKVVTVTTWNKNGLKRGQEGCDLKATATVQERNADG